VGEGWLSFRAGFKCYRVALVCRRHAFHLIKKICKRQQIFSPQLRFGIKRGKFPATGAKSGSALI
jgi:hypothetical protein